MNLNDLASRVSEARRSDSTRMRICVVGNVGVKCPEIMNQISTSVPGVRFLLTRQSIDGLREFGNKIETRHDLLSMAGIEEIGAITDTEMAILIKQMILEFSHAWMICDVGALEDISLLIGLLSRFEARGEADGVVVFPTTKEAMDLWTRLLSLSESSLLWKIRVCSNVDEFCSLITPR